MITKINEYILYEEVNNFYNYNTYENNTFFIFHSTGKNGIFRKAILFTETEMINVYNLALVNITTNEQDISKITYDDLDDLFETNNDDLYAITATIYACSIDFVKTHKNAIIAFEGNTERKIKIYSMYISRYLDLLLENFKITGILENGKPKYFEKNVIYRKIYLTYNNLNENNNMSKQRITGFDHGATNSEGIAKLREVIRKRESDFIREYLSEYIDGDVLIFPEPKEDDKENLT